MKSQTSDHFQFQELLQISSIQTTSNSIFLVECDSILPEQITADLHSSVLLSFLYNQIYQHTYHSDSHIFVNVQSHFPSPFITHRSSIFAGNFSDFIFCHNTSSTKTAPILYNPILIALIFVFHWKRKKENQQSSIDIIKNNNTVKLFQKTIPIVLDK